MRAHYFTSFTLLATLVLVQCSPPAKVEVAEKPYKDFVLGQVHRFYSDSLGEERVLNIYLPDGYSPDSVAAYPVIYLLDGSANEDFVHVCGIVQFLNMTGKMPPHIVVGIANVDRKRDFTMPTRNAKDKADYPTTGHSAAFMACLKHELMPYVNSHFKTNGSATLIGQSLGGLLATQVLAASPGLFDRYMIVSPSLWWDDESLLTKFDSTWGASLRDSIHVFLSVGNEEKQMTDDADAFAVLLKNEGGARVKLLYEKMPAEDHLTILHRCLYRGFELWYF